MVEKILHSPEDGIREVRPFGWAEREAVDVSTLDYSKYECPFLERVLHEAFIAPDGTWYACCLDAKAELNLGNVVETSIQDVFSSQRRQDLIASLRMREFDRIGGPCRTVSCCQTLYKNKCEKFLHTTFKKVIPFRYKRLIIKTIGR
jgi:hypothetical protein